MDCLYMSIYVYFNNKVAFGEKDQMCHHNGDFLYWFAWWGESSWSLWGVWRYFALRKGCWSSILIHVYNKIRVQEEREVLWMGGGGRMGWYCGSEDFQVLLQVNTWNRWTMGNFSVYWIPSNAILLHFMYLSTKKIHPK